MFVKTLTFVAAMLVAGAAYANDPAPVSQDDAGKWLDANGDPTYKKEADGTVDYYTWMGYKRYTANCMACHGPDGMGSSFAPPLAKSLQKFDYSTFAGIVASGQQNKWNTAGNSVMPAWGTDLNVMCYMDYIYVYLRARADGAIDRGEPKKPPLNKTAKEAAYSCLGFTN
ncbi:c-type cytochrome, methanol metabolism-related [Oryzibacter oryziterrae]|uniref:c-type cytochrome, methanol metabolism-related n=1 Tax=Oryzibacter oryziterrae TaxID=2766474 RepID=UPI001F202B19|nr:c-type cytochrome, methanol metabolism-related [Oryzibacter oryziterrae]